MRYAWGWRTIARPIATRWRWPPDSAPGLRSTSSVSPSTPATEPTRSRSAGLGVRRSLSAKARLSHTRMCGYSA